MSSLPARPTFDTGHLLTFKTPRSVRPAPSPALSHALTGSHSPSQNSLRSPTVRSPALTSRTQSSILSSLHLTPGGLIQKLLSDEHAVAAQNMSEIANRRDISILKLSEMCSFLRADLQSLEQDNVQLSARLQSSEAESQQLRLHIGTLSHHEARFHQLESQHSILQTDFAELRSREQDLSTSLKETERDRDHALHQLSQSKLKTAAANESARHATTLMQAIETDLLSAERARQNLQDLLTSCELERDGLQGRYLQVQRELEISRNKDAQSTMQIDLLKQNLADSQKAQSRSDSALLQLRQELQRQQECSEDFRSQLQSAQALARTKEEESNTLHSMHGDELSALRNQIISNQILLKEKQNDISLLISEKNEAQSKCKDLQLNILSLESSRADVSDTLQAQISANARSAAQIRELQAELETQSSKQRDHFENELRHSRDTSATLQAQLDSVKQQLAVSADLCLSQQQSIYVLTHKLEVSSSERMALEIESDSLRSRVHKFEAALASIHQESQAQFSNLSSDLCESKAKIKELQHALSNVTCQCNELSSAHSTAAADLELKDLELKSTIKQARTKIQELEESRSQLQVQYLQLQHEFSETTAQLQQQLLASEQSASSRASRILALEETLAVLREATSEARGTIPILQNKLNGLSEENSSLRSQMLSNSLVSESSNDEKAQERQLMLKFQNQIQEKEMQLAILQQTYEHKLKAAQQIVDQQNAELQRIQVLSARSDETVSFASLLPSHAARLGSALGTLKGQVRSLRQSYNDEIQALWVSVGKSMEAILSIAKAESTRNRTQIVQLHQNVASMSSRNSELETAMSKDAAVYEASEAALIFERVRWETRVFELQDSLVKAENGISSTNSTVEQLKESLNAVSMQLLGQQLRMAGLLATLYPLFLPNDHVLSTLTDGLCPNVFVLRMCSKICSQHSPEFAAALVSHFDFVPSDSAGASTNQASEFHESALKLRHVTVTSATTLSLQLIHAGIREAIRSKSQSTPDIEAQLLASKAATSICETQAKKLRLEQTVIELKGQLQTQSLNNAAIAAQNANLQQQIHEFELRLERQASQFAADNLFQKQTNEQVLAAHELQASNALSALQEKLVQVHAELEKLRVRNREETARARADARSAYEQRIQDATNESLADSSALASFIESSVAEALSLEQSTLHLQSRMQFDR